MFTASIGKAELNMEDPNLVPTSGVMNSASEHPQVMPNDPFCFNCWLSKLGHFGNLTEVEPAPQFDADGNTPPGVH